MTPRTRVAMLLLVIALVGCAAAETFLRRTAPTPLTDGVAQTISTPMYKFPNQYERDQYCGRLDNANYDLVNCDCPTNTPKKCVEGGVIFCVREDAPCQDETCAWRLNKKMCWEDGMYVEPRADGTCDSEYVTSKCPGMSCPDGTCVRSFMECKCPAELPQKCVDLHNETFTCVKAGTACDTFKMECPFSDTCAEYLEDCDCPMGRPFKSFQDGAMFCFNHSNLEGNLTIDNVSPFEADPTRNITLVATGYYAGCDTYRNGTMAYKWECLQDQSTASCPTNVRMDRADLYIPPNTLKVLQTYRFRSTLAVQDYLGDTWDEVTVRTLYPPLKVVINSGIGNFMNSERSVIYDRDLTLDASATLDMATGKPCDDCKYEWIFCAAEEDWRCFIPQFKSETFNQFFKNETNRQDLKFSSNLPEARKLLDTRWRITVRVTHEDKSVKHTRVAEGYVVINIVRKADMPELRIENWPHAQFYYRKYLGHLVLEARLGNLQTIHPKNYNVSWSCEPPVPMPYGSHRMQLAVRDADLSLVHYRFTVKVVDLEDPRLNESVSVLVQVGQGPRALVSRTDLFDFQPAMGETTEIRDIVRLSTNVAAWEQHKDQEILFRFAYIQQQGDDMIEMPISGFDESAEYSARTSVQLHSPTSTAPLYFVLYAKYLNGGETRVVHPLPYISRALVSKLSSTLVMRDVQAQLENYQTAFSQPLNGADRLYNLLPHDVVTFARVLYNISNVSSPQLIRIVDTLSKATNSYQVTTPLRAWELSAAVGQIALLPIALKPSAYHNLCETAHNVASRILEKNWTMDLEGTRRYFHATSALYKASLTAPITHDDIGLCQTKLRDITRDVARHVGHLVEYGRKVELKTAISNFVAVRDQPRAFTTGGFQGSAITAGLSTLYLYENVTKQFEVEDTVSFVHYQAYNPNTFLRNPALLPDDRAISLVHTTNVLDTQYALVPKSRLDNYTYNWSIGWTTDDMSGSCRFWEPLASRDRHAASWSNTELNTTSRNYCSMDYALEDVVLIKKLDVMVAPVDRGEETVTDLSVSMFIPMSIETGSKVYLNIPPTSAAPTRPTASLNGTIKADRFSSCTDLAWQKRGDNVCAEYPICRTATFWEAHSVCWRMGAQLCSRSQTAGITNMPPKGQCNETEQMWTRDEDCAWGTRRTTTGQCLNMTHYRSFMCCSFIDAPKFEGTWDNDTRLVTITTNTASVGDLGRTRISFSLTDFQTPVATLPKYPTQRDAPDRNISDLVYVRVRDHDTRREEVENVTMGVVKSIRQLMNTNIWTEGFQSNSANATSDYNFFFTTQREAVNATFEVQMPRLLGGGLNFEWLGNVSISEDSCTIAVLPGVQSVRRCAEECSVTNNCVAGYVRNVDAACLLKSCSGNVMITDTARGFRLSGTGSANNTLQPLWSRAGGLINASVFSAPASVMSHRLEYDSVKQTVKMFLAGHLPANSNVSFRVDAFGILNAAEPGHFPLVSYKNGNHTTEEAYVDLILPRGIPLKTWNVRVFSRAGGARTLVTIFFQSAAEHAPHSRLEVQFPANSFSHHKSGEITILRSNNDTFFAHSRGMWNDETSTLTLDFNDGQKLSNSRAMWFTVEGWVNPSVTTPNYDPGVYPQFRILERLTAGSSQYKEAASAPHPINPSCDLLNPTRAPSAPSFKLTSSALDILEDSTSHTVPGLAYDIVGGEDYDSCAGVTFQVDVINIEQRLQFITGTPSINAETGNLFVGLVPNFNGFVAANVTAVNDMNVVSAPMALYFNIVPVNDPPVFQLGPDIVMAPNDVYTVNNWIYDLRGGPTPDENVNVEFSFNVALGEPIILPTDNRVPRIVPDAAARRASLQVTSAGTLGVQNISVSVNDNGAVNNRSATYTRTITVTNDWLVHVSMNQTYYQECRGVRVYASFPRIPNDPTMQYTGEWSSNIPQLEEFWRVQNEKVAFVPGTFSIYVDVPQWLLVRYAVDPFTVTFNSTRRFANGTLSNATSSASIVKNNDVTSAMHLTIRGSWATTQGEFLNQENSYSDLFFVENSNEAQVRVIPQTLGCAPVRVRWSCAINRASPISSASTACSDLMASGALNQTTLNFAARSLPPGIILELTGTVGTYFGNVLMSQAVINRFFVSPRLAPLAPLLVGGAARQVSGRRPFVIDGSHSRDASYSTSSVCVGFCSYTWSVCRKTGNSCVPLDVAEEMAYFNLPANTLTNTLGAVPKFMMNFQYVVRLTMSSSVSVLSAPRSAYTEQTISFVDANTPTVTITRMFDHPLAGEPSPRLVASNRLILQGTWEGQTKVQFPASYNDAQWTMNWEVSPELKKPLGRSGATLAPVNRLRLVVRSDMHDPAVGAYTYTLVSSATIGNQVVQSRSSFIVNVTRPITNSTALVVTTYNSNAIPPAINASRPNVDITLARDFEKFNSDPLMYRYTYRLRRDVFERPIEIKNEGTQFFLATSLTMPRESFLPGPVSEATEIQYIMWARATDGSMAYREGNWKPIVPLTPTEIAGDIEDIMFNPVLTREEAGNALAAFRTLYGSTNNSLVSLPEAQRTRLATYLTRALTTLDADSSAPDTRREQDVEAYLTSLADCTSFATVLQKSDRGLVRSSMSRGVTRYFEQNTYMSENVGSRFFTTLTPLVSNYNRKLMYQDTTSTAERAEMQTLLTNVQKALLNYIEDSQRRTVATKEFGVPRSKTSMEALVARDSPYRYEEEPIAVLESLLETSASVTSQTESESARLCSSARRLLRRMVSQQATNTALCTQSSVREESVDHTGIAVQPALYLNRGLDQSMPHQDALDSTDKPRSGSLLSIVVGHTFRTKNFDPIDIHGMRHYARLTIPSLVPISDDNQPVRLNNTQCVWFNERRNRFWTIPAGDVVTSCMTDHFTDFALRALPPQTALHETQSDYFYFPWWGILLIVGGVGIIAFVLAGRWWKTQKDEECPVVENYTAPPPAEREVGESVLDAAHNGA
eukprot:PhM_4_TR2099/c1_g1_i1/m.36831